MCDCLERIEKKLAERLRERVPADAEISKGFDTGWDNTVLSLSSGKMSVMMKYKMAYRAKKKNDDMAKNLTRLECSVKMSYCPFCGKPADDNPNSEEGL